MQILLTESLGTENIRDFSSPPSTDVFKAFKFLLFEAWAGAGLSKLSARACSAT